MVFRTVNPVRSSSVSSQYSLYIVIIPFSLMQLAHNSDRPEALRSTCMLCRKKEDNT